MSLEVRWTEEAEFTFDHTVTLIQHGWGSQAALNFRIKTRKTLTIISTYPLSFQSSGIEGVRKAVITSQTSVFYEIFADHVTLLYFWDNRQNPLFI
jgi:plasmid stabilization system protein ParE